MATIISKQIKVPKLDKKASNCEIGERVYTTVNGTRLPFIVVHQGKPSSMYSDSCIGTWLLSEYVDSSPGAWNFNYLNDYANSSGHSQLNSSYFNSLSSAVRGIIQTAKIPYRPGYGASSAVSSGENGLSCKIFSLSGAEIGVSYSYMPVDGAKLDYFLSGTSADAKNLRRAKPNGSSSSYYNWWIRTPYTGGDTTAWYISSYGDYTSANCSYSDSYFFRPAFIIPYSTVIDKDTNDIVG